MAGASEHRLDDPPSQLRIERLAAVLVAAGRVALVPGKRASPRITIRNPGKVLANRSALVSEALNEWLARRRVEALNAAYAHLATLETGDLAAAGEAAVAMGLRAMAAEADG